MVSTHYFSINCKTNSRFWNPRYKLVSQYFTNIVLIWCSFNKTRKSFGFQLPEVYRNRKISNSKKLLLDWLFGCICWWTTQEAAHVLGPRCRCMHYNCLKKIEDKWIYRLSTFYPPSGLKSRDDIVSNSRDNFKI